MVHLVTQGPKGLPGQFPQNQGINLVAILMILRVWHSPPMADMTGDTLISISIVLLVNNVY